MRILLIHNYYRFRGGEEGVYEQEVAKLRELGYVVETLAFSNEQFGGSVVAKLTAAVQALYNRTSARRVEAAIDAFRPDVVHIHNLFYEASPAIIRAAKHKGVPVVMTLHNYRLVCSNGVLMRPSELPCERCLTKTIPLDGIRFGCFRGSRAESAQLTAITSLHKLTGIWQEVDRFITLTDFARHKLLQSALQLRPDQIAVKPNFVPDLGFNDVSDRDDFFLFVGRLSPEKGIDVLLKAIEQVNVPLEIIGEGPLEPNVTRVAKQHPWVRYQGQLPRQEVISRMKRCRAIVVPSIWYEGLPTVILEAFATGTPVICSDQGNLNQIVQDGVTGQLFRTGQPDSLAQTLSQLDRNPQPLQAWGRAGRQCFEDRYTERAVIERLVQIYETVLKEPVLVA